MSFPRYEKYRDSGVEWLGELPAHWAIKRLKQVFREREERSTDGAETLLSVSAYTGVTPRSEIIDVGDHLSRADSLVDYKVCHADDLVVNIMLAWNRGLGFAAQTGIVSPAYCVYRVVDGSVPRFLNYLVRSDRLIGYFKAFSSGVIDSRLRIYPEVFGRLFCALPPHQEQVAIASFLDSETAKIDALVEEQKRLIELLKEKRQAVISHAVTKGLNPNAPMKDSGVEWLGEVPVHWGVSTLRWWAKCASGSGLAPEHVESDADEEHMTQVIGGNGLMGYTHEPSIKEEVLSVGRVGALCGNVHIVTPPSWITDNALVLRPARTHLLSAYTAAVLRTRNLNEIAARTAQPLITGTQVLDQRVPMPSLYEQGAITEFIEAQTAKLDGLIAEAVNASSLLAERRTALISAAVTGKIDVRRAGAEASV